MKHLLGVLALVATCCQVPPPDTPSDRERMASLVQRTVQVKCEEGGWGSGVILGPGPGGVNTVIATAAHVADDSCTPLVRGKRAKRVAYDEDKDVALLLVTEAPRFPPLVLSGWYLGMPVVTVGYPRQPLTGTAGLQVSRGHLLAVHLTRYKVSSPAFFGNSGGPVFDEQGALLGLLVSMVTSEGYPVDGHYYAVPGRTVIQMYEDFLCVYSG